MNATHADEGAGDDALEVRTRRSTVPGYSAVLVRAELKEDLRTLRRARGLMDSNMERCMVSAALDLVLHDETLRSTWLSRTREALALDADLLTKASA